ncbi:MAG TPA: hypothetical protein PLZ79_02390 [Burkholderiales bacterium]|nr:hypothetical protein [Burkholderiales bacterium]
MADHQGTFEVGRSTDDSSTIVLDGDTATLKVGCGPKRPLTGQTGNIEMVYRDGQKLFRVGTTLDVSGGGKVGGQLELFDDKEKRTVIANGMTGGLRLGGNGKAGDIVLEGADGEPTIRMDGKSALARFGGHGANGQIVLFAGDANPASDGNANVHLDGANGNIVLGKGGTASIRLDGQKADLFLGGANEDGSIVVRNGAGTDTINVDGRQANVWIGGGGFDGDLVIHPSGVANNAPADMSSIHMSGDGSFISIRAGGQETIRIDGKKGDIILHNADGAEEFQVDDADAPPGTVLVIRDESRLRISDRAYDRRVAGVISGAAGIRPGIVLGRGHEGHRVPVALFGRVNCLVDASYGAVEAGDLLTTSDTPGHAMRAHPGERALGALIGKALGALPLGRGLVPVLVALQ